MKRVDIINQSISKKVFSGAFVTEGFFERLRGLILQKSPLPFGALVIDKCDSIHTFLMRFELDAVFLNRDGVVLQIVKGIKPFRIVLPISNAYYVIEAESSGFTEENFRIGDKIEFV